jgi:hypothetical protein
MAIETKAYGLRARRSEMPGGAPTMLVDIPVAAAYGTALYVGDPIALSGGYAVIYANGLTPLGVAKGFKWVDEYLRPRYDKYLPASTTSQGVMEGFSTAVVTVEVSQGTLFDVLANAALTQADIGKFAAFTFGSADTLLKQSGVMVDSSSKSTLSTSKDIQIVGAAMEEGNLITDSKPKLVVRFIDTPIG